LHAAKAAIAGAFCHRSSNVGLDIRPNFSYQQKSRSSKDAFRMRSECGASAVLPRGLAIRAGAALGIIPFGITAEA
jgi:hypothetical protein